MKPAYKIINCDNIPVVLINNSQRVNEFICELELYFAKENYIGNVIFDLLISNGTKNRFFTIPFSNGKFEIRKIKKIEYPSDKVYNEANKHFSTNKNYLNNSILSRFEKNKINNNLVSYN